MITIRLCGGLGNQLFQWALGIAFGSRGRQVQFDTTLLDFDEARRYLLGDFGMKLKLTNANEPVTFQEKSLRFDPAVQELVGDHVLQGYWQSEKYFNPWAPYIRKTLFVRTTFSMETIRAAALIKQFGDKSCFVHIRRTDNLRPTSTMYHGLTNANESRYYGAAMAVIFDAIPEGHIFIFSDDPDWCAENFHGESVTVIGHNRPSFTEDETHNLHKNDKGREVEDLWLMSLCRHGILSNSTFAWWGAYLNVRQENRIVIAPDPWYSSEEAGPTEIIPDRWMKVATK